MKYSQSLSFLNSFLNLEQVAKPHSRVWNLKRMRELLEIFGHPEKGIFTILVGGTKGKGSTAYFLSEILRRAGLQVGFYHSPHLEHPNERIWINGKAISKGEFARGLLRIQQRLCHSVIARQRTKHGRSNPRPEIASGASHPRNDRYTYFEIMTLLAALLFKEKGIETAVYEVGMGGRLDATNTLPAKLVILTPIHYDHEAYLGYTLDKIAREKAAILRMGRDVVTAPQLPEARREIQKVARRRKCPVWSPLTVKGTKLQLLGDFQELNAHLALRAASILRDRYHFPLTREAMIEGVGSNHWPGRMELFKGRPSILLDGAHNPKSIEALARNVRKLFPGRRTILIFGTSHDKRSDRMLRALGKVFDTCILTQSRSNRAQSTVTLLSEAKGHFSVLFPAACSHEALALAGRMARPEDLIVGTGSFYLIGELRKEALLAVPGC